MIPLRRSVLYVPADKPRALEKAVGLAADVVIIDLEDSVAPANKEAARQAALAAVGPIAASGKEVVVRINGSDTPWYHGDVTEMRGGTFAALVLPKVKTSIDVKRVGLRSGMCVWPMMETAQAVLEAKSIAEAAATTGPAAMVLGLNDIAAELDTVILPGRPNIAFTLQSTVLAAKAAGIDLIDGVVNAYKDEQRLRQECKQARMLGFTGKSVIHPAQIEIVNRTFSPKAEAIAESERIVAAMREAEAAGSAVATLDGRLVETLHARAAERLLALAAAIAERKQKLAAQEAPEAGEPASNAAMPADPPATSADEPIERAPASSMQSAAAADAEAGPPSASTEAAAAEAAPPVSPATSEWADVSGIRPQGVPDARAAAPDGRPAGETPEGEDSGTDEALGADEMPRFSPAAEEADGDGSDTDHVEPADDEDRPIHMEDVKGGRA